MNGFNGYNNGMNNMIPVTGAPGYWQPNVQQQQQFGAPQQSSYPTNPQQDTVIDWVMGRSGAEGYTLKPNTNAFLMDSNNNGETVYTKSTDMTGRYGPLRSFKMVPFEDQSRAEGGSEPIDYERIRSIISEEVTKQMEHNNQKRKDGNK